MALPTGTDPRVLQVVFVALVTLDLCLRFAGAEPLTAGPHASAVLMVLATLALFALLSGPVHRHPVLGRPEVLGVVAVLDIAVIGLCRLSPAGSAAAVLLVGPSIWLGLRHGRAGVVVTAVCSTALVALPGLVYAGSGGVNLSRTVMPVVVAVAAAYVVATTVSHVHAGRDLTEQQRHDLAEAAETIERQQRHEDAIFDTVDVGLVLLDHTGAYQTMNRRHQDFMRLAFPAGHAGRAGQLGRVYDADGTTLLTEEQMPSYRASLGEQFEDRRLWIGEDPLTRRAVSVSARSIRDRDGAFAGAALAYKDVTGFMRALQVKDEFVASVSHELRTPLTSIHGYASIILERSDLPVQVINQLEVVVRNTGRLNRLVADLLQSAQVEDGPMHVVRTRADVAGIVRESVEAATPAASAAGLRLSLQSPESLAALVDAQRFAQVVDNLVSNAIKYTPHGGCVEVRLGIDHDRIDLSVTDTGIGIDAADRDRLFGRFFRSRQAQEQSIQGVGLGLSIAKAIVESHGGRIEVDSDVGAGSVFRVRIPLDADHPAGQVG